jgi:chemotaxis protein histidine kinase CheA
MFLRLRARADGKIPHAETLSADLIEEENAPTNRNEAFAQEAEKEFDRIYSIEGIDKPLVHQQSRVARPLDMLNRTFAPITRSEKAFGRHNRKMKVDLKLLENASESASELTAVRHRLHALNEDQILGITAIREMLELNSLQHGQFTTALRGYFNQQPSARTSSDDAHLERFTDLSAMQVALGAQIDEILAAVHEVFDYGQQKRNALRDQGLLISGLQRDLLDSRLVPFMNVKPKLTNAIEHACSETKKTVNTTFVSSEVIMDKMIQDNIAEPLTHILKTRSTTAWESPAEREAAGKSAAGNIEITVYRKAKNVVITVKDDGGGIDIAAVRKKAIEKRIINENDDLSDKEIMRLITHSGFSTAKVVTSVSGAVWG